MNEEQWYETYMPKQFDTVLSLRELGLTEIPESISEHLENVTVLDLSFNKLVNIPSSIGKCSNLQELWLNNNEIVCLPDISKLCLTRLDISHNKLMNLSDINSVIIDAGYNQLMNITNLGYNTCVLNLHDNQLTQLEFEISQLPNLQILNICNNRIKNPEAISNQFTHPISEFWYSGNDS